VREDDTGDEDRLALEILSVTIGNIAEEAADLAAGPPEPPRTYASLAATFGQAASEISALAAAMAVIARRAR
jgi:hypothetical protein